MGGVEGKTKRLAISFRYEGNSAAGSDWSQVLQAIGYEALAVSARLRVAPAVALAPITDRSRRYGAASFACQKLAWFTEPKLAEGERRMVDQTGIEPVTS